MAALSLQAKAIMLFQERKVDFGKIEWGDIAAIEFGFENTGDSVLVIKKISSACGCVIAGLPKKEFNPGEKGTIKVWFKSRGYHGDVTKRLTVKSNDRRHPRIRLQFSGKVVPRKSARKK